MLSHVMIGVSDFEAALRFYSALMRELGIELRFVERDRPWAGWQSPGVARPLFLIGHPYDGRAHEPGNGQMTAFTATSHAMVDRTHALALALGGTDEGPPALRAHYHPNYYGAYFRDPDGNKLCVVCHTPP